MMAITLASKTTAMIDEMIAKDQGSAFRGWLGKVMPHMGDAYRTDEDGHRSHMGASVIGGECARAIWYNFRWATKSAFTGRLLRLFNRGHLEEARFIACLLMIGAQVYQQDANGKQYRISASEGHYGGSGDGVVIGIPDLPAGQAALCEFKTHNDKSFIKLKKEGVRDAKFEHYVQMQQYMRKMGIPVALYMAVNKNNDEIYAELIYLDVPVADQFLERADKLVWMQQPPKRVSESPGWFACQWCDHRPICHLKAAPDRNCRTCGFSQPVAGGEGQWMCNQPLTPQPIDKARQLVGCDHYSKKEPF
jgi:hypothetical protein